MVGHGSSNPIWVIGGAAPSKRHASKQGEEVNVLLGVTRQGETYCDAGLETLTCPDFNKPPFYTLLRTGHGLMLSEMFERFYFE